MLVRFCTLSCDPLKLDKRDDFANANPVNITVKASQPCNAENPVFILAVAGVFSFNYCYVPLWGKYYFLGEPTYIDGTRLSITGTCDVLTTNADEIKQLTIIATRSNKTNKKLSDKMRPVQVNRQSEIINFNNSFSPAAAGDIRYVLTVQGGAHN